MNNSTSNLRDEFASSSISSYVLNEFHSNGRRHRRSTRALRVRTDLIEPPMIKLRQFRSGDLDALYAISLATGHEGGDASHLYKDAALMGNIYS